MWPSRRKGRAVRRVGSAVVSGRAPPGALRVLVSFTTDYAAYGEAIFLGLREARPGLLLRLASYEEAEGVVARFRPHLVVSDGDIAVPVAASVRIPAEPTEPSTMRLGETVRTVVNPSLEDLLAFVDDVVEAVGR